LTDLFRQLAPLVQNHTEAQLKTHRNGPNIYVPIKRVQRHTNPETLERQKRQNFRLIQQDVDRSIDLNNINRHNDQSTPLMCNQNIHQQRRRGGSTGCSE
jgi:hypothetical protein